MKSMIKGIGIDIIEISRIRQLADSQPKFIKRILTEREMIRFEELGEGRKMEYLAGRFAAKEAFSKAFGTGIGEAISFDSIEIVNDVNGKPYISKPFKKGVHLSISHCKEYAAAQVVIEE